MKKIYFVLTCLTAATAAQAQTSVTIYGVADAGITLENNGGAPGNIRRLDSGILNGSRLGFRGTEDLGGGLSALFLLETGINLDDGTAAQGALAFGRQTWVGLASQAGTLKLGRQLAPVYANNSVFDPFADGLAGDTSRLFSYGGFRINNAITYGHEKNGFRGQVLYGFGEVAGNTAAARSLGAFGGYKSGPVDVVLTWQKTNNVAGTVGARTTLLGGNYDFGPVKAYLAYAWNRDATATGVPAAGSDTRDALIGLTAPVGAGSVKLSWIKKTNRTIANANATQIAIGYVHDLSKRTALYTSAARLNNDTAASYKAGAPGATDKLLDVGIRHTF